MADLPVHRFRGRDGAELVYRELGEGRPLVMLHGFLASSAMLLDHGPAAAIAEHGHRVILPDLRGHGDSARPHDPESYPRDVLVDDGFALLDHLGSDDYDLAGYSLGARVALRMLARGAKPAHAVVAGQGLDAVNRSTSRTGGYRRVLDALIRQEPVEPGSADAEMAMWITRLGADPLALSLVLDSLVPTPESELREIAPGTLVVVGAEDTGHATADALADALPAARFVRVPGNHFTAMTTPEFASTMIAFLDEPVTG